MSKTTDIRDAMEAGRIYAAGALVVTAKVVYSYQQAIAYYSHTKKTVTLNITKYSRTTRSHVNLVRNATEGWDRVETTEENLCFYGLQAST